MTRSMTRSEFLADCHHLIDLTEEIEGHDAQGMTSEARLKQMHIDRDVFIINMMDSLGLKDGIYDGDDYG